MPADGAKFWNVVAFGIAIFAIITRYGQNSVEADHAGTNLKQLLNDNMVFDRD